MSGAGDAANGEQETIDAMRLRLTGLANSFTKAQAINFLVDDCAVTETQRREAETKRRDAERENARLQKALESAKSSRASADLEHAKSIGKNAVRTAMVEDLLDRLEFQANKAGGETRSQSGRMASAIIRDAMTGVLARTAQPVQATDGDA